MPRRHPRPVHLAGLVPAVAALGLLLPSAAAAQAPCDDLVVTHRPDGSTGDTSAVTITAQAIERGTDGWSMVAWDVAESTDVSAIVAVAGGTATALPAGARATEDPVEELHFCGAAEDTVTAAASGTSVRTPAGAGGDVAEDGPVAAGGRDRGGGATALHGLLGAAVGLAIGGVVLLLSRGARNAEVAP